MVPNGNRAKMKVAEVPDSVIVSRHEGLLVTLMNGIISPSDMTFLCIFGHHGIFCGLFWS